MSITTNRDHERFRAGAEKYAAYLDTPEGRLRIELSFANLQEFLPVEDRGLLRALDVGCGTGAMAVRLAGLGVTVTLLDCSPEMLTIAESAAERAGLREKIGVRCGEAAELRNLFPARSFDLVICHNLLEYVDEPCRVLAAAADVMRDGSAVLSLLVRNQAGEVLKAAIRAGDLAAAERNLGAEWGQEALYGGKVRLFTPGELETMLKAASLEMIVMRGVRVISDYLPPTISSTAEYGQILHLERRLGSRPEFASVARYLQCLARRKPHRG